MFLKQARAAGVPQVRARVPEIRTRNCFSCVLKLAFKKPFMDKWGEHIPQRRHQSLISSEQIKNIINVWSWRTLTERSFKIEFQITKYFFVIKVFQTLFLSFLVWTTITTRDTIVRKRNCHYSVVLQFI